MTFAAGSSSWVSKPPREAYKPDIVIDRETGRSRGFIFVTFGDEKAMRDAIKPMNGQELDGRNITVNEAQSRGGDDGGEGGGFRGSPRRDGCGYGGRERRRLRRPS
ncbi:Glycine-rich RNA-binding protein 8 [Striga hermonthica]|uniref:Glycine-rich RNA-binding protein 8 n=1 Tax=Striga hermonthica TaxID=68872 RepID=A0A9N7MX16_STRHE|nr:Glycine-rich RNA-binding protein 8 [Striga hermonthica]